MLERMSNEINFIHLLNGLLLLTCKGMVLPRPQSNGSKDMHINVYPSLTAE